MKKNAVILFFLLFSFVTVLFVSKPYIVKGHEFATASVCYYPIRYKIGSMDARFGFTQETLQQTIERASTIWGNAIGKELFVYDPKGDLTINLVYDKRQALTTQINDLESQLDTDKSTIQNQISQYKQLSSMFEERVTKLNEEINGWNSKGGAPPDEFERLKKEQQELKAEAEKLNTMAATLNQSTSSYNIQISDLNDKISSFNSVLRQKPEEGVYRYRENSIDIYFMSSKDELIHTLAHELGHALGISHNDNKQSIMFAYSTKETTISEEDIAALHKQCKNLYLGELLKRKLYELKN